MGGGVKRLLMVIEKESHKRGSLSLVNCSLHPRLVLLSFIILVYPDRSAHESYVSVQARVA